MFGRTISAQTRQINIMLQRRQGMCDVTTTTNTIIKASSSQHGERKTTHNKNHEVRIEKHASYNSENNHFLATSSLQQETLGKHEHQESARTNKIPGQAYIALKASLRCKTG